MMTPGDPARTFWTELRAVPVELARPIWTYHVISSGAVAAIDVDRLRISIAAGSTVIVAV